MYYDHVFGTFNPFTASYIHLFCQTGIEDKLIAAKGYCIVVTDEGCGFFDDLKRKETKHEGKYSLNKCYVPYFCRNVVIMATVMIGMT